MKKGSEKEIYTGFLKSELLDYTVYVIFTAAPVIILVHFLILKIFGAQLGQKVNILVVMYEMFLSGIQ